MADLLKTLRQIEQPHHAEDSREGRPALLVEPECLVRCANCRKPTTVALLWCATCDRDNLCINCREPDNHRCHTPKPANWGE